MRSRKTLIYLILTLNHCYPDYDFSLLRAHHFRKEPGVASVEEAVDSHLLEVSKVLRQLPIAWGHLKNPCQLCSGSTSDIHAPLASHTPYRHGDLQPAGSGMVLGAKSFPEGALPVQQKKIGVRVVAGS